MSTTYTWKIDYMDTKPQQDGLENVVVSCRWSLSGTDGEQIKSNFGYTHFEAPQTGDFTAYADLTEAQVLAWVWAAPSENGGVVQADAETAVEAAIEAARTPPTVVLGNPWIPALPPTPDAP
jgi:uncharacterized lipoprotein YmbA